MGQGERRWVAHAGMVIGRSPPCPLITFCPLHPSACEIAPQVFVCTRMKFLTSLVLALGLVGTAFAAPSKIADISHQELSAALAAKTVTVLDVNGSESFAEGRIPGSIDFIAQQKKIAALLPKDKKALVVAYCGNEYCSAYLSAATVAMELGYTNVKHYSPGIDGWKKSGGKLEKS